MLNICSRLRDKQSRWQVLQAGVSGEDLVQRAETVRAGGLRARRAQDTGDLRPVYI